MPALEDLNQRLLVERHQRKDQGQRDLRLNPPKKDQRRDPRREKAQHPKKDQDQSPLNLKLKDLKRDKDHQKVHHLNREALQKQLTLNFHTVRNQSIW